MKYLIGECLHIPANHSVESAHDINLILDGGFLLPTIYWIKPKEVRYLCRAEVEAVRQSHRAIQSSAVRGMYNLAKQRELEIARRQKAERIKPSGLRLSREGEPSIECEDILAGELDLVFLMVGNGNWYLGEDKPTGFEFDARHLVERGAHVRLKDLISTYAQITKTILTSDATSAEATRFFKQAFEDVRKQNEHYGSDAISMLEAFKNAEWWEAPELVYPGPLPIEWATGVWRSGKYAKI